MPVVMERQIQRIKPDKWDALAEIDNRFDAIEATYKYPPKRRYRAMLGPLENNCAVLEREWKSMAKMEEAILNAYGDPAWQALVKELNEIVTEQYHEVYLAWPLKV